MTQDRARASAWSLALASQDIPHRVVRGPHGWMLQVPSDHADAARRTIEQYERENARPAEPASPVREYGPTQAGFVIALALPLLFLALGSGRASIWTERGAAHAGAILSGEWWRTLTALTLHADLPHVLANAVSCAVFVTLLCRWIGPGPGLATTVLAGALGNALNAWVQPPGHVSVGASTALFGAIGVLAGMAVVYGARRPRRRSRLWLPVAGGLGLLAMLGTGGERTDVLAHLFGLVAGLPVGLAWATCFPDVVGTRLQIAFAGGALALLGAAWLIALSP